MADEQNTSDTSTGSDIELVPEKKAKKTFSFVGKEKERKGGRGRGKGERIRSEFAQSIISIRRVARVVAGGRRFSFSVALVAGDRNGKGGVGLGKAGDTTLAIDKALQHALKHMITFPLTKTKSIPRETEAKFASSVEVLKPAPGKGHAAGSSVCTVL